MSQFRLFSFVISLLGAQATQAAFCYAPDGVNIAHSDFAPCINIENEVSMCCGTNRTDPDNTDICQQNGLCRTNNTQNYFRDYCTDPTWQDPNCLKTEAGDMVCSSVDGGWTPVTQCADGTWCCGSNNFTDCCNQGLGFKIAPTLVNIVAASSKTNTSSTETITAIATVTSISKSSSSTTAVGVGLGVGLGALAILGTLGGFFAGMRRGRGIAMGQQGAGAYAMEGSQGSADTKQPMLPYSPGPQHGGAFHEHLGGGELHEAPANSGLAELGNSPVQGVGQ